MRRRLVVFIRGCACVFLLSSLGLTLSALNKAHEVLGSSHSRSLDQHQTRHKPLLQQQRRQHHKPTSDCALLFFGLPRSYESMVLPSIIHNVLLPNKPYKCDVYAHAHVIAQEAPGRSGLGGPIDVNAIYLLNTSIHQVYHNDSVPRVAIATDTEQDFWRERGATIKTFRTTKSNVTHKLLYHPWADKSWSFPESMDNVVRQWHSIQAVWNLMERQASLKKYSRIAMLRSDVFYATPIDVYAHNTTDSVIIPGFARHPVNDRMIIGDLNSVKIWATERFDRIDAYVRSNKIPIPGLGMHSEYYMKKEILPAIEETTNATITHDASICFMRVRADQSAWISDCDALYDTRLQQQMKIAIENITGLYCQRSRLQKSGISAVQAVCSKRKLNSRKQAIKNSRNNISAVYMKRNRKP